MLSEKIGSHDLAESVLACLVEHKKYLFSQPLKVCSKIWFQVGNQRIFGRGLAKLLENIERTGTLQQAAIDSGMSYRYAWKLIQTAQERLGKTLVDKHPGGKKGGASALSPAARNILDVFNRLNETVADFADKNFHMLYEDNK
jgi:molybdate transport system regulatory protein